MTAAVLSPSSAIPSAPTLSVAAGRNLVAAGAIFALANLFQWGVMSGALHLHPAVLSLSWPVAVTLFLIILRRLRRAGGEAGARAASWSRRGILVQIGVAASLAVASGLMRDWSLMMWMSPIGLGVYGLAYSIAAVRGGPGWLAGAAIGAFAAAAGVALLVGTPSQYLAYGCGLIAFAFLPGLALAAARAR
ncbi:MAG: hypothetical protein KJ824_12080 [Alphaproteobacteria bacterium]|nr:hypothetical protein [Alphaproteobacteria bacterium]